MTDTDQSERIIAAIREDAQARAERRNIIRSVFAAFIVIALSLASIFIPIIVFLNSGKVLG